jgi:hypothetical protein
MTTMSRVKPGMASPVVRDLLLHRVQKDDATNIDVV